MLELQAIEYLAEKGRPVIHSFWRDEEGRRIKKTFKHRPWFAVPESRFEQAKSAIVGFLASETGAKSIFGEDLRKVIVRMPRDVRLSHERLRAIGIPTYEADLPSFTVRWMIDQGIFCEWPPQGWKYPAEVKSERTVVLWMDVETIEDEVVCLTCSCRGEMETFHSIDKSKGAMLEEFLEWYLEQDPDVLLGWNIDFDLRALIRTFKNEQIDFRQLSPLNQVTLRTEEVGILGREPLDYGKVYQIYIGQDPSLRIPPLEHAANQLIGKGKLKLPAPIPVVWEKEPKLLLKYNRNDVLLMLEMEEKHGLFWLYNWLRKATGVRLRDVKYPKRLVEAGLFRLNMGLLPTTSEHQRETYRGAIRLARKGIYSNVMYVDFRSFYPEIVRAYNISPETLLPRENSKKLPTFKIEPRGVLPALIDRILEEKEKARKTKKQNPVRYQLIKILSVASYGQLGNPQSRIYSLDCAEAVAGYARKHISELQRFIDDGISRVIYLDTDGLAFPYSRDLEERKALIEELNKKFAPFSLEEAYYFTKALIVAKARFIGRLEDGKLILKGVPLMRSDTPAYFREVQLKLANLLLDGASKPEILRFLHARLKEIKSVPPFRLARPVSVRKETGEYKVRSYFLKALEASRDLLGLDLRKKWKIHVLPFSDGYLAIEEDSEIPLDRVNWKKLEKNFLSLMKSLYELRGISESEIKSSSVQTRLT